MASLRRDTPVLLRLEQTVSSGTARSGERIEFSNSYHPWREGAPLVYADRFKR